MSGILTARPRSPLHEAIRSQPQRKRRALVPSVSEVGGPVGLPTAWRDIIIVVMNNISSSTVLTCRSPSTRGPRGDIGGESLAVRRRQLKCDGGRQEEGVPELLFRAGFTPPKVHPLLACF